MRVLNYLELEDRLDRAGIGTAADHQRAALADTDVEVITSPWRGDGATEVGRNVLRGRPFDDYDVAHCNLIGPGSVAVARHAARTDTPLVLHCHVTAEDFRESFRGSTRIAPALKRYLRWFYSQADLVLTPSEYTKSRIEEYPVEAPIRPMSNGVDLASLEGFEDYREEYRERYDLSGPVVFSLGGVFERKGLTRFCELAREFEDLDFAWFGTYDTGPQASKTVRKWTSDPPENVTFTGWVEEKRGIFGAGDVYLFPTKEENQGIAALEAMACGKACIMRDLPVFREYYEDGHDCVLCSTHAEFRDAIERLVDDPEERERLGRNARETAEEHSLDRVGERLVETYEELLDAGR